MAFLERPFSYIIWGDQDIFGTAYLEWQEFYLNDKKFRQTLKSRQFFRKIKEILIDLSQKKNEKSLYKVDRMMQFY